jgi:tight adherence protein B
MVTGALLSAAMALVLWPDSRGLRRVRLVAVLGPGVGPAPLAARLRHLPIPPAAAAGAAMVGGLVSTPLVALLAGAGSFLAARAWRAGRAARRTDGQLKSLAEGLGALAADLRSGRSLEAATDAAVAAVEVGADDGCGPALARALRAPAAPSPDGQDPVLGEALGRISSAVVLSGRTGCSLAAVVGAVEDDLRARCRQRLELRAATAAPRASALLLAALPLLGLAMGSGVGADPWGVLTGTGAGQVLLVVGVALEGAGLAWSRALVERAVR